MCHLHDKIEQEPENDIQRNPHEPRIALDQRANIEGFIFPSERGVAFAKQCQLSELEFMGLLEFLELPIPYILLIP